MGRLQQGIIRYFLNLERVCLEARGKGLVVEGGEATNTCSCLNISYASLYVILAVGFQVGYYTWHFKISDTSGDDAFNVMFLLDLLGFLVFLSFPFAGPMHLALGYFENKAIQLQSRLSLLYNDRGTAQAINLYLFLTLVYLAGDCLEFVPSFSATWQIPAYFVFTMGNIFVYYGGILLVILAMRAILVRLYRIEHQVEYALDRSLPPGYQTFQENHNNSRHVRLPIGEEEGDALNTTGNDTGALDHDTQTQEWTEEYRLIRKVVHDFSEHFGSRMLFGLFLFLCETTSMITLLWEEAGETLGSRGTVALMVCFVANAVMLCATFHSMAFLVVESCHHIGPKVAILAVRCHGEAPRYQVLASAFLHAPPKIHVGVFEVAPEYASAVFLWFLGLFLLVFGLKMPGAE